MIEVLPQPAYLLLTVFGQLYLLFMLSVLDEYHHLFGVHLSFQTILQLKFISRLQGVQFRLIPFLEIELLPVLLLVLLGPLKAS